jgi:cation transport regulator ChaB
MPRGRVEEEVPSTVARSDQHAQRLWKKAHDSAVDTYGEGQRAHRTAFAALKHEYRKVGDRWKRKDGAGPSDPRAAHPGSRRNKGKSYGGVDVNASKEELYEEAKKLDVPNRSKMGKQELAKAIDKANQRKTAAARSR